MNISKIGTLQAMLLVAACGGNIDLGSNHGSGGLTGQGGSAIQGDITGQGGTAQGGGDQGSTPALTNSGGGGATGNDAVSCSALGGQMWPPPTGSGGMAVRPPTWEPPPLSTVSAPLPQECDEVAHEVWEGQRKDAFFNPIDTWRVTLTGKTSTGQVCGTVTYVGDGSAAPPPPTDANLIYPPGFQRSDSIFPRSGFSYSIVQGGRQLDELRLRIVGSEVWKDWCALRTPELSPAGYGCFAASGFSESGGCCVFQDWNTGLFRSVSMAQCDLCPKVCACDAGHCTAALLSPVDLTLTGDNANLHGTIGKDPILLQRVE